MYWFNYFFLSKSSMIQKGLQKKRNGIDYFRTQWCLQEIFEKLLGGYDSIVHTCIYSPDSIFFLISRAATLPFRFCLITMSMVEKFETLNWLKNGTEKTLATRNMTFKIVNGMTLTKHFVHMEALVDISVTTWHWNIGEQ